MPEIDDDALLALHTRVLTRTADLAAGLAASDLDRPTPCADWNLAQLLAHMTGQNHGFAAAALGEGEDRTVWSDRPVGGEPGPVYRRSVDAVLAAVGERGALDRGWLIPEIRAEEAFPGRVAIGFHLLDYVVHGWDVAAAIGADAGIAEDAAAAAYAVAVRIPDGANRMAPGASFAPALAPRGGPVAAELLRAVGRDPEWRG